MIIDHPSFEELSELADGELPPATATSIEKHVAECAACQAQVDRLRALIERAGNLAASIDPPVNAWPAVRGQLRPHSGSRRPFAERKPRFAAAVGGWGVRAAAALVLVASSSALTLLIVRGHAPEQRVPTPGHASAPMVPAAVRAVDRSYADVLDELAATIRAQHGALTPATVTTLERTLHVIDQAIAEARAALAADPGNGALSDVLSANYEQKVQLLRRASELPART